MIDITQPSVLGFPVTVWFIAFTLSVVGTIVFTVLSIISLKTRKAREQEMINAAVKSTSSVLANRKTDKGTVNEEKTESIFGIEEKTDDIETEGLFSGEEETDSVRAEKEDPIPEKSTEEDYAETEGFFAETSERKIFEEKDSEAFITEKASEEETESLFPESAVDPDAEAKTESLF